MRIPTKSRSVSLFLTALLAGMMVLPAMSFAAQPTVNLGTTAGFAILAGETITNTGATTVNGDIGLAPGTDFPGQADITLNGALHLADAVALQAQNDLVIAYADAAGRTPVTRIETELGGKTLLPGVYDSESTTFEINGTLTLDAQGDPDAVFIFKMGKTLVAMSGSNVNLINGARFCRVFWQVGSSATLGTGAHFVGHILADVSITLDKGATVQGQLLAKSGSVVLNNNTITNGFCSNVLASGTTTPTATPRTTVAGGKLPNTATPWYNILVAGSVLAFAGAFGLVKSARKMHE